MNKNILNSDAQAYISEHFHADVHQIAMGKSPLANIEARELANQIAARQKSVKKLPTWHQKPGIYYPPVLSIEQTSSETTALYKSRLAAGKTLIDLTGGFGIDSYYFSLVIPAVTHCEINTDLSEIAAHNAQVLGRDNISFVAADGLEYLKDRAEKFDTVYIDPARRNSQGKVFKLAECSPNVVAHLDLLLEKAERIIIKTAPLLDISAGLKELKNVAEVHIVSVRNECKELLWLINKTPPQEIKIVAATLNENEKSFAYFWDETIENPALNNGSLKKYLYEPDVALLKSGAFNRIAIEYQLEKLDQNTQLYTSDLFNNNFPGRIFSILNTITPASLKKDKDLKGNVVVRNYPDKAENLVRKYKIKPDNHKFLIFTQSKGMGNVIINAIIEQHY